MTLDWLTSMITAAVQMFVLLLLGAPPWAAFGFAYVVFLVLRAADLMRERRKP